MSKRYFIELTVNFNPATAKQKEKILKDAAARMAKGLCSIAVLLTDRTDPRVRLHIEDDRRGSEGYVDLDTIDTTNGHCPLCGHEDHADEDNNGSD